MLTVKKFGVVFDLSIGGYIAAVLGLILAILTIQVFPPDNDLADDDDSKLSAIESTTSISSSTDIVSTLASILASPATSDDEDEPISPKEKNDEINDTVLGVNICLIFFGWLLVISSLLLAYGTFKRQSRLCLPYMFALFETVLLLLLLEALPEFIDELEVKWFLLINFLIALTAYLLIVVYSLFNEFKEEELNRLNF